MRILVIDVENVITYLDGGKRDFKPFRHTNRLVSVGWASFDYPSFSDNDIDYAFFNHSEGVDSTFTSTKLIQSAINEADIIVGHNLKHDLQWLIECGWTFDFWSKKLFDTQICEFVFAGGQPTELNLEACCKRYGTYNKKSDLIDNYYKQKITFDLIPKNVVEEYGRADIKATAELFLKQYEKLNSEEYQNRIPTVELMNEFCHVLTNIEINGIAIDIDELDAIEKEFRAEKDRLTKYLEAEAAEFMGDTPINLGSPEQLSKLIYSREIPNKHAWKEAFNLGKGLDGRQRRPKKLSVSRYAEIVKRLSTRVYIQKAHRCSACEGSGFARKFRIDGTPYKRTTKCRECEGMGVTFTSTKVVAGLRMSPISPDYVTANGFATDKTTLSILSKKARTAGKARAADFLDSIVRLSALDVYLSSFVGGIRRATIGKILHPTFNQTIAATGRLSSSEPNFQNIPRGNTFPARRAIVSRFPGGCIMDADYGQLEFRVAGQLSGCARVYRDIAEKIDVHAFTAQTLTESGQETDRQGAKSHTFKPLYGGQSGTPAEQAYYKAFAIKYKGVAEWHTKLQDEAIQTKKVILPSGRVYHFPQAVRTRYGGSSSATKIKNYPVQGFATADIVPSATIELSKLMVLHKCKSVIINCVHDSITVDVSPDEVDLVRGLMLEAMLSVPEQAKERWNYVITIPLAVEVKAGPNWMEQEELCKIERHANDDYPRYDGHDAASGQKAFATGSAA